MMEKDVEDIYTLSAMQQGMLFDILAAGDPGTYLGQSVYRLRGELSVSKFRVAWTNLLQSQPALRTGFLWEKVDKPLQVVKRSVDVPLRAFDWCDLSTEEQSLALKHLLAEDRRQGFDLSTPPLMRLTLVRTGNDEHQLIWTVSHLVIDGWSEYIALRSVLEGYWGAGEGGQHKARYRDYIAWQKRQDMAKARDFWSHRMEGLRKATLVCGDPPPNMATKLGRPDAHLKLELLDDTAASIRALARQHQLTLNTLYQGAWAIYLAHLADAEDVIFGSVYAGRPPELAHVEEVVGLFVNTLPVRLRVNPRVGVVEWLRSTQTELAALREFETTPLTEVRKLSRELPRGTPLFDSIAEYVKGWSVSDDPASGLAIDSLQYINKSSCPLILKVVETSSVSIEAYYDVDRVSPQRVQSILEGYRATISQMVLRVNESLEHILGYLREGARERRVSDAQTRRQSSLAQFKRARPMSLGKSGSDLVRNDVLQRGSTCLPVVSASITGLTLSAWSRHNRKFIARQLQVHGALLLREFPVEGAAQLVDFVQSFGDELVEYRFRASPRTQIAERIYSSTDYPPDQTIFPHNEHAFCPSFPLHLYFCCLTAAQKGGQTPIGSVRFISQRLSPQIKERFARTGVMYVRNYGDGMGLPWEEVFGTSDRNKVEEYCRQQGITCEWKSDDRLRTRYVGPAVVRHPHTREELWFNHATFFHVTTLPEAVRDTLLSEFTEQELPNNTFYGDGSSIEASVLEELRGLYQEELLAFEWRNGDVLMLDNMLSVHGRMPYEGPRKVVVGMAGPTEQRSVALEAG